MSTRMKTSEREEKDVRADILADVFLYFFISYLLPDNEQRISVGDMPERHAD